METQESLPAPKYKKRVRQEDGSPQQYRKKPRESSDESQSPIEVSMGQPPTEVSVEAAEDDMDQSGSNQDDGQVVLSMGEVSNAEDAMEDEEDASGNEDEDEDEDDDDEDDEGAANTAVRRGVRAGAGPDEDSLAETTGLTSMDESD